MEQIVKRIYPTNPLGIIAVFVFFIEAISALTIVPLRSTPYLLVPVVYFIVSFPVLIALCFFLFLWKRPQVFFSPGDYKSDELFLSSIRNEIKLNQQIVYSYSYPPTVLSESLTIAEKLILQKDYLAAVRIGRGYLKQEEYYKSLNYFKHVEQKIPRQDMYYAIALGNIGYSLVGLDKYEEALRYFREIESKYIESFKIWHLAALCCCFQKTQSSRI